MQNDCIAVALGLPQLKILWQQELEGYIEVTVIYRRDKATCPRCGKITTKEHDRRQVIMVLRIHLRRIDDMRTQAKRTTVYIRLMFPSYTIA